MLEKILGTHQADSFVVVPAKIQESEKTEIRNCDSCDCGKFWRPHQSDRWFCSNCRPPTTESMVAERFSEFKESEISETNEPESVVQISALEINAMATVCEHCRCRWYREKAFSDGTIEMRCWSCSREVDGEPKPWMDAEVRSRGLCKRSV
jgi:hypothetical protein